jgi:hypothetical protein
MAHVKVISGVMLKNNYYNILCQMLLSKYRPEVADLINFNSSVAVDEQMELLTSEYTWLGLDYEVKSALAIEMGNGVTVYDNHHYMSEQGNIVLFPYDLDLEEENIRYITAYFSGNNSVILGINTMLVLNEQQLTATAAKITEIDCRDSLSKLLRRFFVPTEINDIITNSYSNYLYCC